jgi:hypothetical protein
VGSLTSTKKEGRSEEVKYLAILDFEHSTIEEVEKKRKAFWKAHKKYPEKFPDFPVKGHFMAKGKKGFAIWETDDPAKIAYKIGFMLPEVKYTLIPGIEAEKFFKAYFESKKIEP